MSQPNGSSLSTEQTETLRFISSLHPEGRDVEHIYDEVKSVYGASNSVALNNMKGLLLHYKNVLKIATEISIGSKVKIILTDKGRILLWKFMGVLWKENKTKFFSYLTKWIAKNDKDSQLVYKKKSIEIMHLEPQLPEMLLIHLKDKEIIQNFARVADREIDNTLVSDVQEYLGLLVGIGFVETEENNNVTQFFLNKKGIEALKFKDNEGKKNLMRKASKKDQKKEKVTIKNFYKRNFFLFILGTVISMIIGGISISAGTSYVSPVISTLVVTSSLLPILMFIGLKIFIHIVKKWKS